MMADKEHNTIVNHCEGKGDTLKRGNFKGKGKERKL